MHKKGPVIKGKWGGRIAKRLAWTDHRGEKQKESGRHVLRQGRMTIRPLEKGVTKTSQEGRVSDSDQNWGEEKRQSLIIFLSGKRTCFGMGKRETVQWEIRKKLLRGQRG